MPIAERKPWDQLPRALSAPLETWTLQLGETVEVNLGQEGRGYAKVSDIRHLGDGRFAVVYAWLYTRKDVISEFLVDGKLSRESRRHINHNWPHDAHYSYMVSTNRTITLWDTAIRAAPKYVLNEICQELVYRTTPRMRRMSSIHDRPMKWMKEILNLPCPEDTYVSSS